MSLLRNGDFAQHLQGNWAPYGAAVLVVPLDPPVAGNTRMVRLDCNPAPGGAPWAMGFVQRRTAAVHSGDAIYFRAGLRSADRCTRLMSAGVGTPGSAGR